MGEGFHCQKQDLDFTEDLNYHDMSKVFHDKQTVASGSEKLGFFLQLLLNIFGSFENLQDLEDDKVSKAQLKNETSSSNVDRGHKIEF